MRLCRIGVAGALVTLACSGAARPPSRSAAPAPSPVEPRRLTRIAASEVRLQPLGPPTRGTRRIHRGAVEPAAAARRFRNALVPRQRTRAVVLLYHAFDVGSDPLSISSHTFDQQLTWLTHHGVEIVRLSELIRFLRGDAQLPERVAVITIDDGLPSTYTRAWPVLQKHQAPFALGLSTQLIERPGRHPMLSWAQIRELVASGLCELASHGHAHRRLVDLSDGLATQELQLSRQIIERETEQRPIAYFYPLGAVDEVARQRVETSGYQAAFTATGGAIAIGSSPLTQIPRTTVFHADSVRRFSWYFGPQFLQRLPFGWRPTPRFTALETTP